MTLAVGVPTANPIGVGFPARNVMVCEYCGHECTERFCSQEHAENSAVFHILEKITEDLDLVYKATSYPWKVELTRKSYETLKYKPGTHWVPEAKAYLPKTLVYEKDRYEYLVCWENHNIHFIIHARICDNNGKVDNLKLDDLNRPNIKQEYQVDWDLNGSAAAVSVFRG